VRTELIRMHVEHDQRTAIARQAAGLLLPRGQFSLHRMIEQLRGAAERDPKSATSAEVLRIAAKAEHLGEAAGLNVAKTAWMDAAKVNGLIVDRAVSENVNTNYVVSGDPIGSVEDWEAEHAAKH
jgi:hypothetical protein